MKIMQPRLIVRALNKLIDHFANIVFVTVAYVTSFALVQGFVFPIQSSVMPEAALSFSLLFLPHGVRVIAFHFYGWKAALYLLPAVYISWGIAALEGSTNSLVSPLVSILACLAAWFIFQNGRIIRGPFQRTGVVSSLVIMGTIASFFNSIGLSYLNSADWIITGFLGYLVGDTLGMLATYWGLLAAYRILNKLFGS